MSKQLQLKWEAAQHWYNERDQRERIMLAALLIVVVVMLWLFLIHDQINKHIDVSQTRIQSLKTQLKSINQQKALLTTQKRVDPDQEIKQRMANLKTSIGQVDTQLKQRLEGLIEPKQMAQILEEVFTQSTSMRLIRVESVPAKPLIENEVTEDASTDPVNLEDRSEPGFGVFQHGLKMEFEGNYMGTLDYLKKLQAMTWSLFWDDVTLEVSSYPTARVVIKVHTLSLQEGWLGV